MNPCDPSEHFDLCSDCGSILWDEKECQYCPMETVQIPGFLIFGVLVLLGAIILVNIVILVGWLDWFHYIPDFWSKLKGE